MCDDGLIHTTVSVPHRCFASASDGYSPALAGAGAAAGVFTGAVVAGDVGRAPGVALGICDRTGAERASEPTAAAANNKTTRFMRFSPGGTNAPATQFRRRGLVPKTWFWAMAQTH